MDCKSREKRLKIAALAWACTLTPPTGCEGLEPPSADGSFCFYSRVLATFARLLNAKPRNAYIMSSFRRF